MNKCSEETLERVHEHGIDFDLNISAPPPDVEVEIIEDVDVEAQSAKSASCLYWTDKKAFLDQFNLKDMDEKNIPGMNDLLWIFRHCFFNVLTLSQFHEGIRCKPIKIKRLPGVTPRKEKMRQISDKKLSYL